MFVKFLEEHLGSTAITRWLNETGSRTRGNKPWTNQRVLRMLRNPVYIGKISHDDLIHDGKHEPIIDLSTWQRAQALLDERADAATPVRPPNDSAYLLSGFLRCRTCSSSYVAVSANGRRSHYRYYACRTKQTRGARACDGPRVPAQRLETAVIHSLLDTYGDDSLFAEALAAAQADTENERPQLEAQLASADKQIRDTTAALDRYLRAFEEGSMPAHLCATRVDELTTQRQELTAHRDELASALAKRTATPPRTEDLRKVTEIIHDVIRTGESSATKHLFRQLIHQIKIDPDMTAHPTYLVPDMPVPGPTSARAPGTTVRISEPDVDLTGRRSNPSTPTKTLVRAALRVHSGVDQRPAVSDVVDARGQIAEHHAPSMLTDVQTEEAVRRYSDGQTIKSIAGRLGVDRRQIRKLVIQRGLPRRHTRLNDIQTAEAIELYIAGMSVDQIAQKLDISKTSVYRRLREHGIARRAYRAS